MTVLDAIDWLRTFADVDAELTVDVHIPGDEWTHKCPVVAFKNERYDGQFHTTIIYSQEGKPVGHKPHS